jgi:hypothetical protein
VWSTDWFHRPEEQVRKILGAIDSARREWASRNGDSAGEGPERERPATIARVAVDRTEEASISVPYQEAAFPVRARKIDDINVTEIKDIVVRILEVESPIHVEELARRTVERLGGKRAGKRATEAVRDALRIACGKHEACRDGEFYALAIQAECPVRDRSQVSSQSLRKADMIPPAEIRAAITRIIDAHHGATHDEVVTAVARALGFAATSAQLRSAIECELATVLNRGELVGREGRLYPAARDSA